MDSFKERLKLSRQEKRLTQEALAERIGKTGKAIISNWELGKAEPSLGDLKKLAEALETTSCWLVDGIKLNETQLIREAPPGFMLVSATEYVELQKRVIQAQDQQFNNRGTAGS